MQIKKQIKKLFLTIKNVFFSPQSLLGVPPRLSDEVSFHQWLPILVSGHQGGVRTACAPRHILSYYTALRHILLRF